jgi:hypothetical protein
MWMGNYGEPNTKLNQPIGGSTSEIKGMRIFFCFSFLFVLAIKIVFDDISTVDVRTKVVSISFPLDRRSAHRCEMWGVANN